MISLIYYFFIFLKYLIFRRKIKDKDFVKILLYIYIFCIYLFIYHRKDVNTALHYMRFKSFLYVNVFKKAKSFLSLYTYCISLYASIGFDEVYEMRERSYIDEMNKDLILLTIKNMIN